MRVTMNGVLLTDVSPQPVNVIETFSSTDKNTVLDKMKRHLDHNKGIYSAVVFAGGASVFNGMPALAAGADPSAGGKAIIGLLQQGSKWVGMIVSIWGLWEMAIDAPGWKGRVLKGVGVYVGCLVIPLVFFALDDALTVDGWTDWMNEEPEPVVNPQPAPPAWEGAPE